MDLESKIEEQKKTILDEVERERILILSESLNEEWAMDSHNLEVGLKIAAIEDYLEVDIGIRTNLLERYPYLADKLDDLHEYYPNEGYQFLVEYLNSRYVEDEQGKIKSKDKIIDELKELVQKIHQDKEYQKLREILNDGGAKDLNEMYEITQIYIPGYTFLKRLGEGADGMVYLAHHKLLEDIKIKIFKDPEDKIKKAMEEEGVSLEERIRRRIASFDKKVRDKKYITQLYDVGKCKNPVIDEDTFYITSDYIDSGAVETKDKKGRYRVRDDITGNVILHVFYHFLEGLEAIHKAGLILKDVKLRNLLVSADHKTIMVDDLETIAGIDEVRSGERLTEGSDRYAAPEVIKDITNASQKSDLYSAAVCLLYMATGKPTLMNSINIIPRKGKEYRAKINNMLEEESFTEEQKKFFRKAFDYIPKRRHRSAVDMMNHFVHAFCKHLKEKSKPLDNETSEELMKTLLRGTIND